VHHNLEEVKEFMTMVREHLKQSSYSRFSSASFCPIFVRMIRLDHDIKDICLSLSSLA